MEHKIKLKFGFTDSKGETHQDVVFGRRLTGADLMAIENDRRSQLRTQHTDLIRARSITKFGTLSIPPPMDALTKLNKIDRSDLAQGYEDFAQKGREGLESEFRPNNIVQMYWGFDVTGVHYRLAELNRLTTGLDEVAADTLGLEGLGRELFLLGRSVSKISNIDDESLFIEGPIDLAPFQTLDGDDLLLLRQGAALAEAFFRIRGKETPQSGPVQDAVAADEGNGALGIGAARSADAAAG
jgi:hypothetical protein